MPSRFPRRALAERCSFVDTHVSPATHDSLAAGRELYGRELLPMPLPAQQAQCPKDSHAEAQQKPHLEGTV